MKQTIVPIGMGLIMGPMMLWMLHDQLTGQGTSPLAVAAFVGAHVLILLVVIGAGLFAARLSPGMREKLDRLHRPSWGHIGKMLASAAAAALIIHLVLHGVG